MINFKSLLIISLSIILASCNAYKKHFGGTGHDYTNAKASKPLNVTTSEYPLNKSTRYSIPKIPKQSNEQAITNFEPPV